MNIEIANRLYEYRKKFGYSQEELAEKLGVSRQAISKWERSESSPDTDNLIALSKLYNVTLDELLNGGNIEINNTNVSKNEPVDSFVDEDEEVENKISTKEKRIIGLITGLSFLLVSILFFVLGFTVKNGFAVYWVLFLVPIIIENLLETILLKNAEHFAYPVLIALIYLFLGMRFRIWHPTWILFLTIPVYYIVCSIIAKVFSK